LVEELVLVGVGAFGVFFSLGGDGTAVDESESFASVPDSSVEDSTGVGLRLAD